MDWIVERGVEKIPEGVSFEQACFVEPVNTCVKGVKQIDPQPEDVVVILGQGPIGMIFTMIVARTGANILATDMTPTRRDLSRKFGAAEVFDPRTGELERTCQGYDRRARRGSGDCRGVGEGNRGAGDGLFTAGARVLLFAQTSHQERVEVSGADICMGERTLCGSYSASVDMQKESADLVFSGALPVAELISHRVPLNMIHEGIERALHPDEVSLKIVVNPQRWIE
jgi:L-iditol 2-dehydrogenase